LAGRDCLGVNGPSAPALGEGVVGELAGIEGITVVPGVIEFVVESALNLFCQAAVILDPTVRGDGDPAVVVGVDVSVSEEGFEFDLLPHVFDGGRGIAKHDACEAGEFLLGLGGEILFVRGVDGEAGKIFADIVAESSGGQYFAALSDQFGEEFSLRMAEALAPTEAAGAAGNQPGVAGAGSPVETASDRWARVGAFVGSTVDAQALDYARKTADNTTLLGRTAGRIESVISRMEPATV